MGRAVIILALVSAVLMSPALMLGPPAVDSAIYNHNWVEQFSQELAHGVAYPRWLPESFEGLGSPTFFFYPPLVYMLAGLIGTVTGAAAAISLAALMLLFGSGLAMFVWLRTSVDRPLLWSILYMAAPYHLADFYVRGALAEFAAFVWIPLIARGVDSHPRGRPSILLAVSYAALACSHPPSTLLVTVFLIAPLVVLKARRDPAMWLSLASSGILGVGLAAVYLVPALTLQGHTSMSQILWRPALDPAAMSLWRPGQTRIFYAISWVALGWVILALGAAARGARFWPALAVVTAALAVGLLPSIWRAPGLAEVQFPWRLVTVVEFAAITAASRTTPGRLAMALALAVLLQGMAPFLKTAIGGLDGALNSRDVAARMDGLEYLPPSAHVRADAQRLPDLSAFRGPLLAGPTAEVVQLGDHDEVRFRASSDGVVTFRKASFPNWTALDGPRRQALEPGPLVKIKVLAGHRYRLLRTPTPQEQVGWAVSVASALGLLILAAFPRFGRRRPAGAMP